MTSIILNHNFRRHVLHYYNKFAWLWITWPDVNLRDPTMGIELATRACELSSWQDWSCLFTLAAACGEIGAFDKAVHWADKALELAPEENQADCSCQLQRYRAGQPYDAALRPQG